MGLPFIEKAIDNLFSKPSTVKFPFVPVEAPKGYRGKISYNPETCVNCGMCIKVCSPGAINRIAVPAEGGENITYEFDLSSCTFCGTCQDFCNTKSIVLTENYHMAEEDHENLIVRGTRFKKTVLGKLSPTDACVFCGLCAKVCTEGAITVDRATKTWSLNEEECARCGSCVAKCPKKCLDFRVEESGVDCNFDSCIYCGLCAKNCPVDAIKVDRATKSWTIDKSLCVGCGTCVTKCPKKALTQN